CVLLEPKGFEDGGIGDAVELRFGQVAPSFRPKRSQEGRGTGQAADGGDRKEGKDRHGKGPHRPAPSPARGEGESAKKRWRWTASESAAKPRVRPGSQALRPSMSIISRWAGLS